MNEHEWKLKQLVLSLSFGIGLSLTGLAGLYLPSKNIILKVDGVQSVWRSTLPRVNRQQRVNAWIMEKQNGFSNQRLQPLEPLIWTFPLQIKIDGAVVRVFPVNGLLQRIFLNIQTNGPSSNGFFPNTEIRMIELNRVPVTFMRRSRMGGSRLQLYQLIITTSQNHRFEWKVITEYNSHSNEVKILNTHSTVRLLTTSRGNFLYRRMRVMTATAYYPGPECIGKYCTGLTFTGKKAMYGIVAVDPRVIPLGSFLYIEGYGHAEAADTGGAIRGNRIDLCFNTYREAVLYGRKRVQVYLLE